MEKVQWNLNDKKQNGLKYSKNDKSSTLQRNIYIVKKYYQLLKVPTVRDIIMEDELTIRLFIWKEVQNFNGLEKKEVSTA